MAAGEAAGASQLQPLPQASAPIQLKSPFQRKQDVFDAPDFDPVKFINQIYPDGARQVHAGRQGPGSAVLPPLRTGTAWGVGSSPRHHQQGRWL